MGMRWFFVLASISIYVTNVKCGSHEGKDEEPDVDAVLGSLLGFKSCLDESCADHESSEQLSPVPESRIGQILNLDYEQEEETDALYIDDSPRVTCILLRPSSVRTFSAIEDMHPGIAHIKYQVMEELIHQMYPYAMAKIEDCGPEMKLVEILLRAAQLLKIQYSVQGRKNCTHSIPVHEPKVQIETESPCTSDVTKSPEYTTRVGSTPCSYKTTQPSPVTDKATSEPCPEGTTTAQPCETTTESTKECRGESTTPSQLYKSTTEAQTKPCPVSSTTGQPCEAAATAVTPKSCTEDAKTEKTCDLTTQEPSSTTEPNEQVADDPYFVGSVRGIPGINFPNYTDVPITSFTCADVKYIPGFYADLDTGCQVFHVCYEHRRESFLCPVGTTFNQPILACDYWYSSNCSLAPEYYDVNRKTDLLKEDEIDTEVEEVSVFIAGEEEQPEVDMDEPSKLDETDLSEIVKFLPIKATITEFQPEKKPKEASKKPAPGDVEQVASEIFDKIVTTATKVASKARDVIENIPEPAEKAKPKVVFKPVKLNVMPAFKVKPIKAGKILAKGAAAIPAVKVAAAVKSTIPLTKAAAVAKVAAVKATIPLTAKVASVIPATKAKIALPVSKAKLAVPVLAKSKMAAPVAAKVKLASVVAAKKTLPIFKTKAASALPLGKAKVAFPVLKGKMLKGAAVPLAKAKVFGVPLAKSKLAGPVPIAKAKLAKAAVISPLTKKALALGYMKLLKAKKLTLMG